MPAATVPALMRLSAFPEQSWDTALEELLRIDSALLEVERVSYWSFSDDPPSIVAELGYVSSTRLLERGQVILERDCPEYLAEVRQVQVLAIGDARADARLAGLSSYLERHGIGALLDVPVFAGRKLVGLLCHEHVGDPREWTTRDSELALAMCQTLTAMLEARARSHAEQAERRAAFLARSSTVLARTLDPDRVHELVVRQPIPMFAELVTLIGYDGTRSWRVAQAHQDDEGQVLLDELARRYASEVDGVGIGVRALREEQSLLLPSIDPAALREYGIDEGYLDLVVRLRMRSVMAVPLHVRGAITGVLTFGTTTRTYDRNDLRFAESYAQQAGLFMSNVQLYARAQAAVQARDEFLSLAAHELRTPLMALALAVEVLDRATPPDAPLASRRAVGTLRRQASRLSRLSEILLTASHGESAAAPPQVEPTDMAALVREIAADFEEPLARASCELHLAADTPVVVRADPTELRVVVSNLLDNAMKFGAGHPIEVSVDSRDGLARVVVRDHGIGIPEDQRPALFRRFERGVSAKHFGGLGLGLHIAARIVEAHGGSIRAERCPDEGTAFTVELPREPVEAAPSAR